MRQEDLADAINAAYRHTVDLNWQTVMLPCSTISVMHGRRPFEGRRSVLLRCAIHFETRAHRLGWLEFRHSFVVRLHARCQRLVDWVQQGASVEGAANLSTPRPHHTVRCPHTVVERVPAGH